MRRLLTTRSRGQTKVTWHLHDDQVLDLSFTRLVLGVSWGVQNYACLVGERLLEGREDATRYWIVLDEASDTTPQELFSHLIPLKDDYLATVAITPNAPPMLAETLRQVEGLTHYRVTNYGLAEQRWPSFVDFDHTAALYQVPPPEEKAIHQDLERWLEEKVIHPDHEQPVLDRSGEPVYRLMLPHDFPNTGARTGIQQAKTDPCTALWLACSYLEKRRPTKLSSSTAAWEHRPGKGGY